MPYRGVCLAHRVEIMRLHGDWADAMDEANRACRWLGSAPSARSADAAYYQLGELHRLLGEYGKADQAYREASRLGHTAQPGLALVLLAAGDVRAAERAIRTALDAAADQASRCRILPAYIEVMLAAGKAEDARTAEEELAAVAETLDAPLLNAISALAKGSVLLAAGEARGAQAVLGRAVATFRELDAPYDAARARLLIGLSCRETGDEVTARLEIEAANRPSGSWAPHRTCFAPRSWPSRPRPERRACSRPRAGSAASCGGGEVEPGHRGRPVPEREDGRPPPQQHLRQARRVITLGGHGVRPSAQPCLTSRPRPAPTKKYPCPVSGRSREAPNPACWLAFSSMRSFRDARGDVMSKQVYDAVVVGARCAGAPTAMLLARRGYRVLVVDRATFPSDTISTHLVHPPGLAALDSWGLLARGDRERLSGDRHLLLRLRALHHRGIAGRQRVPGRVRTTPYGPGQDPDRCRSRVRRGGARRLHRREPRDRGRHGDGDQGPQRGRDERHGVRPCRRRRRRHQLAGREDRRRRPVRREAEAPVQLLLLLDGPADGRPVRDLRTARPGLRRMAHQRRPDRGHLRAADPRLRGQPCGHRGRLPGHHGAGPRRSPNGPARPLAWNDSSEWRCPISSGRPYGPGWALVGDAGYLKDFITAQGIQDAFRDAELCARALDETFTGSRTFDAAMHDYQESRDTQVMPMYEFTAQLAALDPPPPELQQLLGAVSQSRPAMDGFARVAAGVTSPADFFSDESVDRIMAA